jgi:uncharacterized protein YprB with RNaseH-like and TPR domain
VAIGDGIDDLTFFEFENTGLSTGDTDIAQTHIDSGKKWISSQHY